MKRETNMRVPTQTEIQAIRDEIFSKPTFEEVQNEMRRIADGATRMPKMNRYYFYAERTRANVQRGKPFAEILESDEKFLHAFSLADRYLGKHTEEKYARCGYVKQAAEMMRGYARLFREHGLPSMFSFQRAREIMRRYNANGAVFDFACGWGQRLVAALSEGLDYYGCDTNGDLCECLERCAGDYIQTTGCNAHAEIFNRPSEEMIPELIGRCGLCFSSPPYFDVEIYRGEKTSTALYPKYDGWISGYLKPTLANCNAYLISGGHLAINIKNMGKRKPMYDDTMRVC